MRSHPFVFLTALVALACGAPSGRTDSDDSEATSGTEPNEAAISGSDGEEASRPIELPPTFQSGQGETAFGVYWGPVTEGGAVTVPGVMAELDARGVTGAGSGEISCDLGAAEALGVAEDTIVVSVSFRTRAEADQFAAAWGGELLGVAEFVGYCRD